MFDRLAFKIFLRLLGLRTPCLIQWVILPTAVLTLYISDGCAVPHNPQEDIPQGLEIITTVIRIYGNSAIICSCRDLGVIHHKRVTARCHTHPDTIATLS